MMIGMEVCRRIAPVEACDEARKLAASGATPGVLEPGESAQVPVYYDGWLNSLWDFFVPADHVFSFIDRSK